MIKRVFAIALCCLSFMPGSASANWLKDLFDMATKIYNVNVDANNISQDQLQQMAKITAGLTGTHDFGSQSYDANRFAWGQGTDDWQSILTMANQGGGNGPLGGIIKSMRYDYPIAESLGSSNEKQNQYYLMQAQTALASRAGAQLVFAQINQEAKTLQYLHSKIDTTADNKSAVDLNNRFAAENTMVNIQQAKLLAILAEQAAVDAQEKANRAKESAEFFNIK